MEGRDGLEGTACIMDYFRTNILDTIGELERFIYRGL